jgi:preprotein translocase subunit SecF
MLRLFANAHFDFMGRRRITYMISAAALILSIVVIVAYHLREGENWVNYGVDFTGGSLITVEVRGPDVSEGTIRQTAQAAIPGSTVSAFGEEGAYNIRTPGTDSDEASQTGQLVVEALRERFGAENVTLDRTESVGAKVGGELQSRALMAILVSLVATLIYIAFRFEWRFGVAAIIATAHDILFTLGFISILRLEVSLPTVAAVLTIVGYSLNDTIVIFDRIREKLKNVRRTDFIALLNRSINETLPRTVLTSGTTLVTLLSLYLFGGVVLRDFALILIVGILLGTYSSIFVAAPALLEIEKRFPHEQKTVKRTRPATTPRTSRV